jgi:hypothetical protein
MDTKNVITRFEAERQALALMDHPNIARVFDAGATDTGRPYFVMELVRGVKITEFCDQNHLDTRQRLDLFIQVCQAIQHAHQKGIIHRDIKPSNILLTKLDGRLVPKVIDFGIAKAIEEPLTDKTLVTAYNQVIGTPAYMSPEQAEMNWLDVDTRSDIYSLGVLLYELLAGRTPFDPKELVQSGIDGMRRTLRETEPHRPSTKLNTLNGTELTRTAEYRHVDPPRLVSLLRGDLDWIVMKALEKDRTRRYETANGLAMDVQRYLDNEPVVARPPSRWYRFQKLVRRNRVAFAAGTAVAAALTIGLGASTWLFLEAKRAWKNEAELRQKAEIREQITQADLLVRDGDREKADELMARTALTQPTLEGAAVLRILSDWHASNDRWQPAVNRLTTLLQVNQLDSWDLASIDFLECSVLSAELRDLNEYETCRHEAIARFSSATDAVVASRVLKLCLLRTTPPDISDSLDSMAKRALLRSKTPGDTQDTAIHNLNLHDFDTHQPYSLSTTGSLAIISAGGANIWDAEDKFLFAHGTVAGDFDCRMRVHSIGPVLDNFTRVGLMARESLDEPGCREVTVAYNAIRSFQMLVRPIAGAETWSLPPNPLPPAPGTNVWLWLQRVGSSFYTYISTNGTDWARLHQFDTTATGQTSFADRIYVGIATCAHDPERTVTAVVSDFSVTPVVPGTTSLALALLEYRRGDPLRAIEWAQRCVSHPDYKPARSATAQLVLAMAMKQLNQTEAAQTQLSQARSLIDRKFSGDGDSGTGVQEPWFDWVYARLLLREALLLAGNQSAARQ